MAQHARNWYLVPFVRVISTHVETRKMTNVMMMMMKVSAGNYAAVCVLKAVSDRMMAELGPGNEV